MSSSSRPSTALLLAFGTNSDPVERVERDPDPPVTWSPGSPFLPAALEAQGLGMQLCYC